MRGEKRKRRGGSSVSSDRSAGIEDSGIILYIARIVICLV